MEEEEGEEEVYEEEKGGWRRDEALCGSMIRIPPAPLDLASLMTQRFWGGGGGNVIGVGYGSSKSGNVHWVFSLPFDFLWLGFKDAVEDDENE